MEADLARLLELQHQVDHPSVPIDLDARLRSSDEILARLIANQRQMVEVLIAIAGDLAVREGAVAGGAVAGTAVDV
jgi:hypothetical protein